MNINDDLYTKIESYRSPYDPNLRVRQFSPNITDIDGSYPIMYKIKKINFRRSVMSNKNTLVVWGDINFQYRKNRPEGKEKEYEGKFQDELMSFSEFIMSNGSMFTLLNDNYTLEESTEQSGANTFFMWSCNVYTEFYFEYDPKKAPVMKDLSLDFK